MIVPASQFFSIPDIRRGPSAANVLVYGPEHLLRAAWLSGARDYLRDPWSVEELYLRLRGPSPAFVEWDSGGRVFRLEGRHLTCGPEPGVRLSVGEAGLLKILVQRRGLPVSRSVLAWTAGCSEGRVVDTLISRVRGKLKALDYGPQELMTVRGLGYRLP